MSAINISTTDRINYFGEILIFVLMDREFFICNIFFWPIGILAVVKLWRWKNFIFRFPQIAKMIVFYRLLLVARIRFSLRYYFLYYRLSISQEKKYSLQLPILFREIAYCKHYALQR